MPVDPWTEVLESPPLEQVPVCMQQEDTTTTQGLSRSENCLFLNVFTPSVSTALPSYIVREARSLG